MSRIERLILDGARLDGNVTGRVVEGGARMRRTMQGASSIELTLDDHDGLILSSGLLTRRGKPPKDSEFDAAAWARFGLTKLTLDGWFTRLAGVDGEVGQQIRVTFEDEVASILRRIKGPAKASRADSTRLQFLRSQARRSRVPFPIRVPEAEEKREIKGDTARERAKERERGFHPDERFDIKTERATRAQKRLLEDALAVCDDEQAGERATLALIVALIQESTVQNLTGGDRDSVGPLQLRASHLGGSTSTDGGRRDVELVCRLFLTRGFWGKGGAIKIAAENPDMQPGEIAQQVQGSGFPTAYTQWEAQAAEILDAYGGVGRVRVLRRRYEFRLEGPDKDAETPAENLWDGSGRLLSDVNLNRFASENVLWMVSDEWLFDRQPQFLIEGRDTPGVLRVTYRADVGRPIGEIRVTADKPIWTGRPGGVFRIKGLGPLNGRWLIDEIIEDLADIEPAELVLRRPSPILPEPAATREQILLTESTPEAGSVRGSIVDAVKRALRNKEDYIYGQVRPYPPSLYPEEVTRPAPRTGAPIPISSKLTLDCSSFVTLAYKTAGADDPNGRGYDGNGFTGTLWANGTKTNDPQPGDLAFYGDPPSPGGAAHVAVYIGDGQCIGFGSNPIRQHAVRYRTDFVGFRSYL